MSKKAAVIVFNPVNGMGLFTYLESFYENGIYYKTFAIADTKEIKSNSGVSIILDDIIANLKGKEDQYDALVFACGDAMIKFGDNANKQYNLDMLEVIRNFSSANKILIGHCAAGLIFDKAGAIAGKKVSVHPYAAGAIQGGIPSAQKTEMDDNICTAETENSLHELIPDVIKLLKE